MLDAIQKARDETIWQLEQAAANPRDRDDDQEISFESRQYNGTINNLTAELRRFKVRENDVPFSAIVRRLAEAILSPELSPQYRAFHTSAVPNLWYCFESVMKHGHGDAKVKDRWCFCENPGFFGKCILVKKLDGASYGPIEFALGGHTLDTSTEASGEEDGGCEHSEDVGAGPSARAGTPPAGSSHV